ncbi:SusC/RagA family TonB-linked outer membrane protein [Niabella drilacis]|uniref:TonB-linked outer membrane protein, SusC/RagA family n=1 Tax=Niabella drilacis (strain DSM 25811 / CCM 8410 / CCUG 62505 / LMG 26954 / E90) TaxID=1285928 RepID=A0A1G6M5S5_NIADE|nr:TonB-dependent receptor [Niabella drilacis]SDC50336.1 TonB-linked outer membrane protein, SusC/RagA family [Niabella drilacis]
MKMSIQLKPAWLPGRRASNVVLMLALGMACLNGNAAPMAGIPGYISRATLQQTRITGKVTDASGKAMEGVTVTVISTAASTATAKDGTYAVMAGKGDVLRFTHTGYQARDIEVKEDRVIDVILEADLTDMEDVVVVAYGKQKKATLTGAIASITTKEIKQSPAANLAVALVGRLPGLTAIQRSGEPGRDLTQMAIRGLGTINSQSPIILVDGVERDLTYIDPNEVESVTILKDASSTAIFGVRGANGVILVTTKRGVSEKPEISFTAEAGSQDFQRFPSLVSSYEYALIRNQMQRNDGLGDAFSPEIVEHYKNGDDPLRFPNTDWKGILLKNNSLQQRYNLNVSGAGQRVKYFVNAGYLNQGGMFNVEKGLPYDPSFRLNRYNFRSNVDIQLNKTLKAMLNLGGYLEKQNMPAGIYDNLDFLSSTSPALHILAQLIVDQNATVPGPVTPDGAVSTWQGGFYPPFGSLNRSGYVQQTRNNIMATFGLEQDLNKFLKGLSAKVWMSFDSRSINNMMASRQYLKLVQVVEPTASGGDTVYYRNMGDSKNTPLQLSGSRFFSTLSNLQGYLNYSNTFGDHTVTGLLLYQQQQNIIDAQLPYNLRGISSRITYGYKSRYFAEFNMGYNGSEQFKKGRRFGFFPAYSAAWVASNEAFMKDVSFINSLKFRASYGKVGNDRIGSRRFLYLDDIQVKPGGYSGSLGQGQQVITSLLKNDALQWEVAQKVNIGMDLRVLNALDITFDYFREKRDNILRNRGTVPVLNGLPSSVLPPVNIGVVENKGFELELTYRKPIGKDLTIMTKLNGAYARNEQVFADEPLLDETYAYRYRQTGYRIGQNFGYIVDRYFRDAEDIANAPEQRIPGHAPKPGDFKYKDLNGDGIIDEKDIAPIGYSTVPEVQYGAAVNVIYKNIDLSILFQGVTNVSNYYGSYGIFAIGNNFRSRHLESWTEERAANGEKISYPRLTTQTNPNENPNSFFINDGSYIRLKNVEVGYTLNNNWIRRVGARSIRFYANGLNLFTWDKLPVKDFDPEMTSIMTYPITRLINFGVNFIF